MGKKFDILGTENSYLRWYCYGVFFLMMAPIFVVIVASFNPQPFLSFSLKEFSLIWYEEFFSDFRWREALWRSVYVALWTVLISVPLGTISAFIMVRFRFFGKGIFQFLVLAPFLIPGLVLGVGLLIFMNSLELRGNIASLVAGHSILTLPLSFLTVRSVLQGISPTLEEAAIGLGASKIRTFFEIILPLIKPGVLAGCFFVFIVSFNEFVISLFLTTHRTMTLPIRIWTSLKFEISPIVAAISTLLVVISISILALAAKILSIDRLVKR
jgi:putative spermidine/putrescine transport system permease protein